MITKTQALLLAALSGSAALIAFPATAQDPDLSGNAVFCNLVETAGNEPTMNARIRADIGSIYNGYSYRINRRKTLTINSVEGVRFTGCAMRIQMDADLKRRIRRDAEGTLWVDATVRSLNLRSAPGQGRGCVKDARVDKVRLSNTLRVGEAFYRGVANKFVESDVCFNFRTRS